MPKKNKYPLKTVMQEVTDDLTENLRQVLHQTLEKELTQSLSQSLVQSEFYRRISQDMRAGLRRIYTEMNMAQTAAVVEIATGKAKANQLFADASEQLSAVLKHTEAAAHTTMNLVEKHMDMQVEAKEVLAKGRTSSLSPEEWDRLEEINESLNDDLCSILTAMSFQDLTGQRIKHVVEAIKQLERTIVELYISTGLMIKSCEEDWDQDLNVLEEKNKARAMDITRQIMGSTLHGPGAGKSQADIDAILAQFDL